MQSRSASSTAGRKPASGSGRTQEHRSPRPDLRLRAGRASSVAAALALSLMMPRSGLADAKRECSEAYDNIQLLRDAEKLEEAIAAGQTCSRAACPKFIREDCAKWSAEMEGRLASIVVEAVDASGAPIREGRVTLDGAPFLDILGGPARVVSKGPHTLEITVRGAPPRKTSIVVREGEKNRRISISIAPSNPRSPMRKAGPWILGGAGIAVLVAGAVTGGLVVEAYGVVQDECDDVTETCTRAGVDAEERGHVLGPLTTGLLIGGTALLGAGIVWLVVDRARVPAPVASLFVSPRFSSVERGLVLGGSW